MSQLALHNPLDGSRLALVEGGRYHIGRGRNCDLRLSDREVARRHAELNAREGVVWIRALGSRQRLWVNGEAAREAGPLAAGDRIALGDTQLTVVPATDATTPTADMVQGPDRDAATAAGDKDRGHPSATAQKGASSSTQPPAMSPDDPNPQPAHAVVSPELSRRFQEAISQRLDLFRRDVLDKLSADELRAEAEAAAWALLEEGTIEVPGSLAARDVVQAVVAETVGLGPIEALMADPAVSEIMVNGPDRIYVERDGRLAPTSLRFSSASSLSSILERIVAPLGRRLDEGSPLVDARLPDGSRVNAIIPPLALNGAALTIRRFPERHMTLADLVERQSLTSDMAAFLRVCVEQRRNILISGGTGTGKTTFLNALSAQIAEDERIITIEDSAELRLQQTHVVALEARPANIEGSGEISIRELVRNALRMRPDRILVGECRGGEALDMLQAMNTGHDGSLTTAHANSPRDAVARLEVMTLMAGFELPVRAIREQIAAAIDIIIQLTRYSDGSRRVSAVTEVDGMEGERILLNDLFVFRSAAGGERSAGGQHQATGQVPVFYEGLRNAGVPVDLTPFQPASPAPPP